MKNQILKMLKEKSKNITIDTLEELTATNISNELKISRNLASQYLNEFVNERKAIKVNKRPVYFLDVEELELKYKKSIDKENYSIEEIEEYFTVFSEEKKDFMNLIGYKGSLKYVVEQCKSAIAYPPDGLPILFYGPTGTGKSYMANLMYEYAVNTRKVSSDKKFVTVNCSEYANNPELLTANLFGAKKGSYTGADKDTVGLIKAADGGILFLDEVHCLKPECQEKLFLFMDKGIYHMVGDNEIWHEANVRLVFATTENPEDVLLKTLLRRIAIIATIPSLEDRPIEERKGIIHHVFKRESENIRKKIRISNAVYKALLNCNLSGNIGQIKNYIKAGCANAFLQQIDNSEYLDVNIYNMPQFLLSFNNKDQVVVERALDKKMINIEEINPEKRAENNCKIVELYESIIKSYSNNKIKNLSFKDFLIDYDKQLNRFYDYIVYSNIEANYQKVQYIKTVLENIFDLTINQYRINIPNNDIIVFSRYLNDYIQNRSEISIWENTNKELIKKVEEEVNVKLNREHHIAVEISNLLQNSLDVTLGGMELAFLTMNIKSLNKEVDINRIPGIILSHGYSTASSIADAANKLLDCYIFDAIDMPLGVSSEEIVKKIKDYINKKGNFNEIILLVDMGSLEDIYKGIQNDTNINIGIINNINTKLALDIGLKLIQGYEVEEILKESCNRNYSSYKYIKNRKLEKVILTVCPTGIGTSKKIAELINRSLPRKIEINIIPQDYGLIVDEKTLKELQDKYDIKIVIGTINPNIEEVPFISLENIIVNNQLEYLEEIFSEYLTAEEIKTFKDNIVKVFSLSNIVDYLTILNAEKVLEVVGVAVDEMEKKLNIELMTSIKIGLYVHLSCLLERLITKTHITSYDGIEKFKEENKEFIEIVRESLTEVEKYFSVEIPVEEIGYIFDYIKSNK
ncbi:sigma 54-interacting transcriptional regulator [Clostridium sp. CTA-7]